MDIDYENEKLRAMCLTEKVMLRELGAETTKKLKKRLTEFDGAVTLADLAKVPQARLHELKGDRRGQWAVDLGGGRRLCFQPRPLPVPKKADGSIDTKRVTGVFIVFIGDYHKG